MGVRNKLKGLAIGAFLSDPMRRALGGVHDVRRRVRRSERVVELYFQVNDPQSYLLAQLMPALAEKYDVAWDIVVVGAPEPDVDPEPAMRKLWVARDARELTEFFELELPEFTKLPDVLHVQRANQVLIKKRPLEEQLEAALTLADAIYRKDKDALNAAQGKYLFEAQGNIGPATKLAMARARKRGYYAGGAFYYQGEWYPGIDRLPALEQRLDAEAGTTGAPSVLVPRPADHRPAEALTADGQALELELFFSFRSPYSYLALDRAAELAERTGIPLRVRPVLPMVMRGHPVPRVKRLYLVRDAKREADRLGIPFGRICDPLGGGVERCLAFFVHAERAGRGLEFTQSAARGIWSEALDPGSYADMKTIVARAGLDWDAMRPAMEDESWREMVASNAESLITCGLWGVPTFRVGSYSTWGQDRLPMVEDRIRRHQAAVAGQ